MILFCASFCYAQDRGSITGSVSDSSGAPIPGAAVTLINPATGLTQNFTSTAEGTFSFLSLPAGPYSITVEKQGFRKADVSSVTVNVNTSTRADIKLEIGQVRETVEVTASASLLQTDRSDLGKVIDTRAIEALPLFASGGMRSNVAFATLTPGVSSDLTQDPDTAGGAPRIAGGTSASNTSLLVDGGESQSERRNDPQMRVVSVEGVEEFKVQTSAYSAEYGRTSNGILNFSTKSGTNDFHANLFAQIRNQALDANGFFYIAPLPSAQTVHNQNLEAVGVGGPVWIPRVYNGRNKLFFFFSGERSRAKDIASSSLISVPTAAARAGDFRGNLGTNGQPITIYNPFDGSGNILANANSRVPFPNNIIPASLINPIASKILSLEPLPQNGSAFLNNNPIVNTGSRTPGERQAVYAIKIDWNPTDKLRLNGLFSRQYLNGCDVCQGPNPGPQGEGFQENYNNHYTHFNGDYIFRPTLLNHFSFNYNNRSGAEAPNLRLGPNSSDYGKSTMIPGTTTYSLGADYSSYQTANFGNFNSNKSDQLLGGTWDFKDTMTWLKGAHSLKFGFEFLRSNYNGLFCNSCGGNAVFSSAATANPSVSGTTGSDLASFLLGVANSGSFNYPSSANNIYPYYAAFIQDDIRVNSKLTVNVGLRWDLPLPKREANGMNSNFDPRAPNPGAGNLPGALVFAGDGPGRTGLKSLLQHREFAFGPRAGFAWQLTPTTVIRGGGAIFYNSNKEDNSADAGIQGFGGGYSTPANYFSSGISLLLPNGVNDSNAGFLPFASAAALLKPPVINPSIVNFGSPSYFSDGIIAQIYDYNFTVEQSLTAATLFRASFHANYGNKLQTSQQFNQLDPGYIPIFGNLLTQPLSTVIANPILAANNYRLPYASYPLTATLAQSLEPFPQYGSINGTTNGGHSTYNALETQVQHNFSNGFFLQFSYTWSKWFADNTSPNVYYRNREKDLSSADRPHVFAVSYVYDLPFGKGRKFGSNLNPFVGAVLGDWRVAAVHHYQSGAPFGVTCAQNLFGAGVARCSVNPGVPLLNPGWNPASGTSPFLNPAAFVQPPNGTFGTLGAIVPSLRNPWQLDEDVALSKDFRLGEKRSMEFRGSAFNIANRHLLGGINSTVGNSAFGQFTNPQSNLPRNVEFSLRFRL
jgi:hypothetical protein